MTGMIERVARAIHFRGGEQDDKAWQYVQGGKREVLYEQARAAIEAMRDGLTEEMKVAGLREGNPLGELLDWNGSHDSATRENIESIWKAMHNAALQEGQ